MAKGVSISDLASSVVDTGRRGEPKLGCDCMQCFGYCIVDADAAVRQQALRGDATYRNAGAAALDFSDTAIV